MDMERNGGFVLVTHVSRGAQFTIQPVMVPQRRSEASSAFGIHSNSCAAESVLILFPLLYNMRRVPETGKDSR